MELELISDIPSKRLLPKKGANKIPSNNMEIRNKTL
jgi:hypothetical protein